MPKKLKHFKQTRYKAHRKPLNKTLLIGIVAACVIFALSVALGAYLGSIASPVTDEGSAPSQDEPPLSDKYGGYTKLDAPLVSALPLPAEAYLSDEEADRAILRANGALVSSLCFELSGENGAPSYKSEVYKKVCASEGGAIDLSLFLEKAKKSNISVCSVFSPSSLSEESDELAELRHSLEIALLHEVYEYGIRELLLTDITEHDTDTLHKYVLDIKASAPELAVGIALSGDVLTEDTLFCAKLADIFDYIALDLSGEFASIAAEYDPESEEGDEDEEDSAPEGEGTVEETPAPSPIDESIKAASHLFLQYGAVVYIDTGDGCEHCTETAEAALVSAGIESFILSRSSSYHK